MAFHKNIKLITWFNFFTDFRLYSAIAILYFSQVTGSFALGMSVFSITMVSSALLEIPTGIFSDRIGRRKTLMLGAAAAVGYSIFYAIGGSFWILAIGALFEGLSRSFYSGNNDALLHDSLTETGHEEEFSEVLGKISSMFQLALGISALIGSIIAIWSFELIMWLSLIPQVICFIIALYVTEPNVKKHETTNLYAHLAEAIGEFKRNPKLRLLSLASIWRYAFGESSYQFSAVLFNLVWPVWAIGLAKTATNLMATASFHFAGRIIKKFGAVPVLIFGSVYNRVICVLSVLFLSPITPALLTTTSLTYGTGTVAEGTLFQKEFKPHQRATMGSLSSFGGNIFFGIVAFCVGLVADKVNPAIAFLVMQVLMLPNIYWQWKLTKHG